MIIKIDIEEGVDVNDAMFVARMLIDFHKGWGDRAIVNHNMLLRCKITHKSKAGNVFLEVSKVEERKAA
jgi:hypothetical protein